MIYVFLNLVLAAFAIGLAFYTDRQSGKENIENNPLIPMSVWLGFAYIFMALMMWTNEYQSDRLPLLFVRLSLICSAAYSIEFCLYCILFPSYERPFAVKIVKYALMIVSLWFCFTKITDLTITSFLGVRLDSAPLFSGRLTNYFPVTLYDLYRGVILTGLPALAAIIMILRAENREDRLNMQKSIVNALAMFVCWTSIYVITKACKRVPLFSTLSLTGVGLCQVILANNVKQNVLYDVKYVIGVAVTFSLSYVMPAVIVGLFFPRLWPIFAERPVSFIIYICFVIFFCIAVSYQISKYLARKQYFRSFQYADTFEESLSKMDYSVEPEEIVHAMQNLFVHNLGLSEIHVLVESEGVLQSIYDQPGKQSVSVPVSSKVFDSMLNKNRTIILKSSVENSHNFDDDKKALLELFTNTYSEAVILLAEGRHLIGALCLGEKAGGNIYSDYDFNTFTKLYSYMFVFGYYMKNIANQSIVGTVNREIRMSSQIIESIQGNIDPNKNPHYDTGWIMEHAHNIGGEFVDLIRLTDKRHIFVLGDLSGKGISASMSMVIVKSIIRTYLEETRDFKLLVEKVNQFIRFNLPKGTFFEGIFGLIDYTDDTLYYINCGVPALFLYTRSYNNVIEIQGEGRVLGFVKDIGHLIKVKKVKLNPGDVIVTVTDGLIDSKSLRGEVYGKERIQKSITESTALSADAMARSMYQSSINFLSKELDDDVSILVIKRLGNSK